MMQEWLPQRGGAGRSATGVVPPGAPGAHITADSDREAIGQWLAEYRASAQTQRAYRREAERLLLWLAEQGLTLGEVRRDHLDAFEAFLADPQPRERWIGPPRPRHPMTGGPFVAPCRRPAVARAW
jgi:hypothetical protein